MLQGNGVVLATTNASPPAPPTRWPASTSPSHIRARRIKRKEEEVERCFIFGPFSPGESRSRTVLNAIIVLEGTFFEKEHNKIADYYALACSLGEGLMPVSH